MSLQAILDHAIKRPGGAVCVALLLLVGAIQGLKAVVRLTSGVWVYFLRPGKNLKRLGPWAVVTGATDGIGLAYARALAKQGRDALGEATSLWQIHVTLASAPASDSSPVCARGLGLIQAVCFSSSSDCVNKVLRFAT